MKMLRFATIVFLAATSALAASYQIGDLLLPGQGTFAVAIPQLDIQTWSKTYNLQATTCGQIIQDIHSITGDYQAGSLSLSKKYGCGVNVISGIGLGCLKHFRTGHPFFPIFHGVSVVKITNVVVTTTVTIQGVPFPQTILSGWETQFALKQHTCGPIIQAISVLPSADLTWCQQIATQFGCSAQSVISLASACLTKFPSGSGMSGIFGGIGGLSGTEGGAIPAVGTTGSVLIQGVSIPQTVFSGLDTQLSLSSGASQQICQAIAGYSSDTLLSGCQQLVTQFQCSLQTVASVASGCLVYFPPGTAMNGIFTSASQISASVSVGGTVSVGNNPGACTFNGGNILCGGSVAVDSGTIAGISTPLQISPSICGQVIAEISSWPRTFDFHTGCRRLASKFNIQTLHVVQISSGCLPRFQKFQQFYPIYSSVSVLGPYFGSLAVTNSVSITSTVATQIPFFSSTLQINAQSCLSRLFGCVSSGWNNRGGYLFGFGRVADSSSADTQLQITKIMNQLISMNATLSMATPGAVTAAVNALAAENDVSPTLVANIAAGVMDEMIKGNVSTGDVYAAFNAAAGAMLNETGSADASVVGGGDGAAGAMGGVVGMQSGTLVGAVAVSLFTSLVYLLLEFIILRHVLRTTHRSIKCRQISFLEYQVTRFRTATPYSFFSYTITTTTTKPKPRDLEYFNDEITRVVAETADSGSKVMSSSAAPSTASTAAPSNEFEKATPSTPPTKEQLMIQDDPEAQLEPKQDVANPNSSNPREWPRSKKWRAVAFASMYTFISPISSSMIAPALRTIAYDLKITTVIEMEMTLSIFVLAYAIGPLILGPLSEIYGRYKVLQISLWFFVLFNALCGFSQTLGQLLAFRFFAGLGGSAPIALAGSVVSDCFNGAEMGAAMSYYALGVILAPALGPIIGGFLTQAISWNWLFYIVSILAGVLALAGTFWLPETYAPILRAREQKASGSGDTSHQIDAANVLRSALTRPFVLLFTQPICLTIALIMAFVYGVMYIVLSTFSELFVVNYGESTNISTLHYLALAIGLFIGNRCSGGLLDTISAYLQKKYNTPHKPEYRLPVCIPAAFLLPLGLFIYGWSAQNTVHWIVPDIGIALFAVSVNITFQALTVYTVDVYSMYAASALAAVSSLRSLAGFGFPLFAQIPYHHCVRGGLASDLTFGGPTASSATEPEVGPFSDFDHAIKLIKSEIPVVFQTRPALR
ncbi:hypothetical protein HDU98_012030 [Podochytrium sp. JEL0797]|nr:hypothetical protein HDU98_012030 [Podochytrium sp. JEL0797]